MMKRSLWIGLLAGVFLLTAAGCTVSRMASAPEPYPMYDEEGIAVGAVGEAPVEMAQPGTGPGFVWHESAVGDITVERMVVRTAELELIVPDTGQALDQIEDITEELDGYVVSLNTYQYEQGTRAYVTIRVPADAFDTALDRIGDLATTVLRESISGQDVTEEYVDLESRLRHLRAKEAQLLEFLDQAEDTEAVLAVYEQLSYTQAEIEQVTGHMQYLENQAALSTINVNLTPDALAQPLEVGGWNLPGTLRNAVESLLDVLEFSVKALIYVVIVLLPTLVIIALPIVGSVLVVRWLVRRFRGRKKGSQ